MTHALIVADDLTGAIDTGHGFAARGRSVRVVLSEGGVGRAVSDDPDALVIDADSRDLDAETAARTVRSAFRDLRVGIAYKKIDSTLRGNVVAEVDAAVDATGADIAVVAPAFPGTGRTTRAGVHYVGAASLADAGYGVDESALPEYFAASRYPVSHLDLDVVAAGGDAVRAALSAHLEAGRPRLVTCDAVDDDDLAAVAAGAGAVDAAVLYVGSGGLAEHVAVPAASAGRSVPERRGDGALAVVGSVNERTLAQLAAVPDSEIVALDAVAAVRDPRSAARGATGAVVDRVRDRGQAVLTAARDASDVDRATDAAATLDVAVGDRISRALALATVETIGRVAPAGLFLSGGGTARACLDALSATQIGLTGDAVADGIPEGWLVDGPAAGTRVVTKAGGFGDDGAIVNCLNQIRVHDD
ncbi:four-carbon acid sugar kinase family protein [Haloferacaceae archaeon DSL9]